MKATEIHAFFDRLPSLKVLVIGDVMVDAYAWGVTERMSPEAPVPVVQIKRTENRPGGAANVALNIAALGAQISLVSLIGKDSAGKELCQQLEAAGLPIRGLVASNHRPTTIKTRIMSGNRQLLRIDDESTQDANEEETRELIKAFLSELPHAHAVIFQDYDKGALHPQLIAALMAACKKANVPTAIDPKKKNFFAYKGAQLFKPNLKELGDAYGVSLHQTDAPAIEKTLNKLIEAIAPETVLLTLSEAGVLFVNKNTSTHIPAHLRTIADVSGAGDTVIAVAGCALAAGLPVPELAKLANLAGGLVCESLGVVPIKRDKLLTEALNNV